LSANAFTKEFSKAKDAGCDDYLTKPISRSKLITMIKKWTGEEKGNLSETKTDEIDEEIRALIPGYLEKRVQDLIILKEALVKKEIQVIARIAHNMKGTALSYGQEELDCAARELNSVSSEADWVKIEKAILKVELALAKK
jgi:YesN/AraC family two-component response regulator